MISGAPLPIISEQALKEALEKDQFDLLYQPVIELETNRIRKAEALIRWRHPQGVYLTPDAFIAQAERWGCIRQVGAWVVERAIHDLATLAQAQPDFEVSVNVSPVQIESEAFDETMFSTLLGRHGVAASQLILEITEGFALGNNEINRDKMARLKALGLKLAIDDFGMGHSALSSLIHFSCDYIKLDRMFVQSCHDCRATRAVSALIVDMAHELDMGVIAEGVETDSEVQQVVALGCDYAQGYYWSPPRTLQDLLKVLGPDAKA